MPDFPKIGIAAFVLACAFPYFRVTPGYTQPYPMLMGALLLFMSGSQAFKSLRASWLMALAGLILLVFASRFGLGYQEIKYFAAYLSPLLIGGGFLYGLKKDKALVVLLLKWAILTWFLVSLIQRFMFGSFLSAWVGVSPEQVYLNFATGRGALGLAPEPTHHAFHILALCAVLGLLSKEKIWVGLGIFEAAVLAGAAIDLDGAGANASVCPFYLPERNFQTFVSPKSRHWFRRFSRCCAVFPNS